MDRLPHHTDHVKLVGLDFGSTTSSALVASARIGVNCATGRMEFANPEITYRSEPVFTPFDGDSIRLDAIAGLLNGWLRDAAVKRDEIFAGGAIITGLAARRDNAQDLAKLIERTIGEAVVATADDPRLESWLAFLGSVSGLSRAHPTQRILNLDIGGGTTNPALGLDGNVLATGCAYIGARHLRFDPGTYRLAGYSQFGRAVLDHFGMSQSVGDVLTPSEIGRIVAFQIAGLEALAIGDNSYFNSEIGRLISQVPFVFNSDQAPDDSIHGGNVGWVKRSATQHCQLLRAADTTGAASHVGSREELDPTYAASTSKIELPCDEAPAITFSGGVGELVYALASGQPLPSQTFYGDLGIDLARAILASKTLSRDLTRYVPENKGRATVQGLTLHSTEVSGTTLFLPTPALLPLRDLPVVASVSGDSGRLALGAALKLASGSARGACLQLEWPNDRPSLEQIRTFGADLSGALADVPLLLKDTPLVLLTTANAGKAIGNYVTDWQQNHRNLIVIDEIPFRDAQFVNLGRPRHGVVPVSFYGLTRSQSPQGDIA